MYFGSVKFFKHLIYTVFFTWLAAATFLAVFFGIKYALAVKQAAPVSAEQDGAVQQSEQIVIPDGTSLDQLYLVMTAKGYSSEDIMMIVESAEPEVFKSYVQGYIAANPELKEVKSEDMGSGAADTSADYTKLYPDLYAEDPPAEYKEDNGTIYLTFDDGPSDRTLEILDILADYDIKATFFFCGGTDEHSKEIMKRVADEGHTVGIHSISHDYGKIYESVESYLADFNETYTCVYEATGVKPRIFRFPGGSINNYNRFTYMQIIAEMTRRGFVYYDWNVSGEDAVKGADWTSIYNNVLNGVKANTSDRAIVLLHDSRQKEATVNVLEDVINELLDDGYHFGQLDPSVKPVTFSYKD